MCDISDRNNSKRLERRNVLEYLCFYRVNSHVVLLREKEMSRFQHDLELSFTSRD